MGRLEKGISWPSPSPHPLEQPPALESPGSTSKAAMIIFSDRRVLGRAAILRDYTAALPTELPVRLHKPVRCTIGELPHQARERRNVQQLFISGLSVHRRWSLSCTAA